MICKKGTVHCSVLDHPDPSHMKWIRPRSLPDYAKTKKNCKINLIKIAKVTTETHKS
jgi:hypothetical protein